MQGYNNIDQRIHQLSLVLAKANRTFVPAKPDDSHTNLYFDSVSHRIYGRWISVDSKEIILALNLKSFTYEWVDRSLKSLQSHEIENKTFSEIEESIANGLADLGLDGTGFSAPLHFETPKYSFADSAFEKWDEQSIQNWEFVRELANIASFELLGLLQTPSEIRIWPHHFDTGIYVEQSNSIGLGFGLAMSDSLLNEPYFYLTGYGLNGSRINYYSVNNLTNGKWIITDNFKGAVLPLSELNNEPGDLINLFVNEAIDWFLSK